MSTAREIRSYDYVNHPYERVRNESRQNALVVFQSATKAAASRAQSVAAELHVDFAGIGVKTDIQIFVKGIEERVPDAFNRRDAVAAGMGGRDHAPALSSHEGRAFYLPTDFTETQLDFSGIYEPPFGAVGKTMNAIAGHRIAEASVHRFVSDVAAYLRQVLA